MAKSQNILSTEILTISTTPHILSALETLVRTGLYGKNRAEAAERLVSNAIRDLILDDTLIKLGAGTADLAANRPTPNKRK
jgi:hypothetical protein